MTDQTSQPNQGLLVTPQIFIMALTAITAIFGLFVTLGYQPLVENDRNMRAEIAALRADIVELQTDSSPKPETKVALEDMRQEHKRLEERLNRLEERFNNLHQFMMQMAPVFRQTPLAPNKTGFVRD